MASGKNKKGGDRSRLLLDTATGYCLKEYKSKRGICTTISEQKNIEEIFIVKSMLGDIYCARMAVVDGVCANLQDDIKSAMPW